jgi:putative ABC transport system ATP-binding protein
MGLGLQWEMLRGRSASTSTARGWPGGDRVAFKFDRVTVVRAGRRVLNKVTASIPAAGITVVSGPSGAGKTTLLRLCNRLEVPDAGAVSYRGQLLDELDPLTLRRRVGMVFQRPTPFPGSVADNLAVAHPGATTEELIMALERVALDPGLLDQEARTLSGGELQRMCLARTLVTQPETLLLDEPTSALDAQPKQVFETTARELAGQGITILWVTHDDAQASRVANRIYQLRDGHLTSAPTEEVRP